MGGSSFLKSQLQRRKRGVCDACVSHPAVLRKSSRLPLAVEHAHMDNRGESDLLTFAVDHARMNTGSFWTLPREVISLME